MAAGMRAILCETPGTLRLVERPRPEPRPGEVIVRVRRMGVCGTDLHIFQGKHPYLEYPRVMGHELSGEIAAAGSGSGLAEGTPVYVMPYLTCGHCVACRQGKTNCCTTLQCLGVHCDGGMCDYLAMPAGLVFPTDGLPLDQAALIEFLAIGAHAARRAEIKGGERTLVVGAGPIGIATALFACARGAQVTFLDPRADRLAFCRDVLRLGDGIAADEATRDRLAALTSNDFFDLVFDATGNTAAMEQSFGWVAHGGTLVLVGVVRTDIRFSDPDFHKREMTLKGSRNATIEDFREVLAVIRRGTVQVEKLITHRGRLEDAPARFPEWIRPETGVVKAMIEL
jgi:2-desacetyl-2-hydroxyethyl bacteriochlorophyllide A dehydrogenase